LEPKFCVKNHMSDNEIQQLSRTIERLQISLNNTQQELTRVRASSDRRIEREGDTDTALNIGDSVLITNPVRLRGSIRSTRNVRGRIVRFTNAYVIVQVNIQNTLLSGGQRYQEIRRASQNLEKISDRNNVRQQ